MHETRETVRTELRDAGVHHAPLRGDQPQEYECRMMQGLLQLSDDPDQDYWNGLAIGVAVGVGTRMPMTPAVFAKKKRWSLAGQKEGMELPSQDHQSNYKSAKENVGWLRRHMAE